MNAVRSLLLIIGIAAHAFGQTASLGTSPSGRIDGCELKIITEVLVPAEEAGVLTQILFHEGDMVEKGALLATLDSTDAELAVAAAVAEYAASRKQAENDIGIRAAVKAAEVAEKEFEMGEKANAITAGALPLSDIQRRKLTWERSDLQAELAAHEQEVAVLAAEAKYKQFERAKAMLGRREIKSRLNGMVVELAKHAGDWASPGDTVMHVIQMDQLRVQGFVPAERFARNEILGKPVDVEVTLTGGGVERTQGRITFASPLVAGGRYMIWAEITNRKVNGQWLLNPGLKASMTIR